MSSSLIQTVPSSPHKKSMTDEYARARTTEHLEGKMVLGAARIQPVMTEGITSSFATKIHVLALVLLAAFVVGFLSVGCSKPFRERDSKSNNGFKSPTLTASGSTDGPVWVQVGEKAVRASFYSNRLGGKSEIMRRNATVGAYGALIRNAIDYKRDNPGAKVEIRFAVYKMDLDLFIGRLAGSDEYDCWSNRSSECLDSERLALSLTRAAQEGISVKLIWQNPGVDDGLEEFFKRTSDMENLQRRRVYWLLGNTKGQQHNKFMLVSHYRDDDLDFKDTVYVSTANTDYIDFSNTGLLIDNNTGLYLAYLRYFEKIFDSAHKFNDPKLNRESFWGQVRTGSDPHDSEPTPFADYCHDNNNLNYSDGVFSAYFYPIPQHIGKDCWDIDFNPVARHVEEMIDSSWTDSWVDNTVKINMFHWRLYEGGFAWTLLSKLQNEFTPRYISVVTARDRRDALCGELCSWVDDSSETHMEFAFGRRIHAKDYLFEIENGRNSKYFVITGSANAKSDAFNSKANNQLVVCETGETRPIYDRYVEFFDGLRR